MEGAHIPLEEMAWGRFLSPFPLPLTLWSDNKTLNEDKNMWKGKGRTNSNLRGFVSTVFHCGSASIEWIHDSTVVEVVYFVLWTRTIVVIYFLDVTNLHLRQLRGLVGNNNWIHQGVSVGHICLGSDMGRGGFKLITEQMLMLSYTSWLFSTSDRIWIKA